MHQKLFLKSLLSFMTALYVGLATEITMAAPAEQDSIRLSRGAGQFELRGDLTKNFYRQEPYQAEYEVQVPYEAQETYTEQVPYEVTVPYTDYEEYYDQEYRCHDRTEYQNECGYETRCRTVPGQRECRTERLCSREPGDNVCHEVEECGTNARGERICKRRKVCDRGPDRENCRNEQICSTGPSREDCRSEYECHQVPRTRQECGYESVRKTREVIRHRTETRYREETRTRTVTRYRSETRCCVTKYADVFDHQSALSVRLVIPKAAVLAANESESIVVTMTGENDIEMTAPQTLYGYKVEKKTQNGREIVVELGLTPKFKATELGEITIEDFKVMIKSQGSSVAFKDLGIRPKVFTSYELIVLEKVNAREVTRVNGVSQGMGPVVIPLSVSLSQDVDYIVELKVQRIGLVLDKVVQFTKQIEQKKNPLRAEDFGENSISDIVFKGEGRDARIVFSDRAPQHDEVKTHYVVKVIRQSGVFGTGRKALAEKKLSRSWSVGAGVVELSLRGDLEISPEDLERYLAPGYKVWVELSVQRQAERLNGGQALQIHRKHEHFFPKQDGF